MAGFSDFVKQAAQAGLVTKAQVAASGSANVQSDWNASSGQAVILNKPSLAAVAVSGAWADLTAKPVLMVASGPSHVGGFVPDPGATAGTVRFLREDATWAAPTAGTQTTSTAVTLTSTSPRTIIFNSASAVTQPLPTASIVDGQEHRIKNVGAGAVSVTGNIDTVAATTVAIAKGSTQLFIYSLSLATWVKA